MFHNARLIEKEEKLVRRLCHLINQIRERLIGQLDELEKLVHLKVEEALNASNLFNKLIDIQNYKTIDCCISEIVGIQDVKRNTLKFKNEQELELIPYLFRVEQDLNVLNHSIQTTLNSMRSNIMNEKRMKLIYKKGINDKNIDFFIFKNICKDNNGHITHQFSKDEGYVAQSLLALSPIALRGIFLSYLFKGENHRGEKIDSQKEPQQLLIQVHEGLSLAQSIYFEQLTIDHNQYIQSEQVVNNTYRIQFSHPVYLRKGLQYSISIKGTSSSRFYTYVHSGKEVKFDNSGIIKFQNKDVENISQSVDVKCSNTYSCIVGYAISK